MGYVAIICVTSVLVWNEKNTLFWSSADEFFLCPHIKICKYSILWLQVSLRQIFIFGLVDD